MCCGAERPLHLGIIAHADCSLLTLQVSPQGKETECNYKSHLLAECGDISAEIIASTAGIVSGSVRLWRLEAVEHLPSAASDTATSAARLREVCPCFPGYGQHVRLCLGNKCAPVLQYR